MELQTRQNRDGQRRTGEGSTEEEQQQNSAATTTISSRRITGQGAAVEEGWNGEAASSEQLDPPPEPEENEIDRDEVVGGKEQQQQQQQQGEVRTEAEEDDEEGDGDASDAISNAASEKKVLVKMLDFQIVLEFEPSGRRDDRLLRDNGASGGEGRGWGWGWGERIRRVLGLPVSSPSLGEAITQNDVPTNGGGQEEKREGQTGVFNLDLVHRRDQADLRSIYLKSTLTEYLNDFYETELTERRDMGIPYAPLDEVYLAPEGGAVESEPASESAGREYAAGYSGAVIFLLREDDSQAPRIPKEFAIQSIQLEALNDETGELLRALRESDPGGITGLDRVASVSAKILKETEGTAPPASVENDGNGGGGRSQLDAVIIVAVVVACLSMALLVAALCIAYRRQRNMTDEFFDARERNTKPRRPKSTGSRSSRGGSKKRKKMSSSKASRTSDRSTPTSPQVPASITASSSPGGDEDDESSAAPGGAGGDAASAISDLNTSLYPDAVSIGDDIVTSYEDYNRYTNDAGNPMPYGGGGNGGGRGLDDSSIMSVDSSQYGYSVEGMSTY